MSSREEFEYEAGKALSLPVSIIEQARKGDRYDHDFDSMSLMQPLNGWWHWWQAGRAGLESALKFAENNDIDARCHVTELEAKCAALAAESEERRQFILNGVEMGFIRLPDKDTRDPATATYERCLNGIQYMPCPKCNDTGMMDSGGTQPWSEPIEIECDCCQQDANTAELVAAGIITKVGE